jgi:hypothetical protein
MNYKKEKSNKITFRKEIEILKSIGIEDYEIICLLSMNQKMNKK